MFLRIKHQYNGTDNPLLINSWTAGIEKSRNSEEFYERARQAYAIIAAGEKERLQTSYLKKELSMMTDRY